MPKTVDHLALMDTSACSGSNGGPENPGAVGATPLDSWEEVKENLKAFTDSVHAKAAQVVSWIQAAEPLQTEGSIRLLDLKLAPKKNSKNMVNSSWLSLIVANYSDLSRGYPK